MSSQRRFFGFASSSLSRSTPTSVGTLKPGPSTINRVVPMGAEGRGWRVEGGASEHEAPRSALTRQRPLHPRPSTLYPRRSARILLRAEKMQRDVWLVADDPTVVGVGRDVKQFAGVQLDHAAVGKGGGGRSREDEPHMLDRAPSRPDTGTDVLRPSPSR